MNLNYTIELLSEWHIGSGLSGGAAVDAIILKDENGLPFVPGKTIKGLLRDALDEIHDVQPSRCSLDDMKGLFGEKKEGDVKVYEDDFGTSSHFSNAVLAKSEQEEIISNNLSSYMYRNIASTKIEKNGLAKDKSLRATEVCVPVILHGTIHGVSEEEKKVLLMAMQWTRRIGMKRNRGYGKCVFNLKNESNDN